MNFKILRYGIDDRDHLVFFLKKMYGRFAPLAIFDESMTPRSLGKNWSCFLCEHESRRFLCFFDGDDGSGGTPSDCKLSWPRFQELFDQYDVYRDDFLVFKLQHAPTSEQRQFYPFRRDVYPLSLMTNDPDRVRRLADSLPKVEQDIDVLFVGGRVHERNKHYAWPKHRDPIQHWPTNRLVGYGKLLEIRDRRPEWKIVAVDQTLQHDEYYSLVNRSKICLDLPGIGLSSRKFHEFMILGRCVLALRQNESDVPIYADRQYVSLEFDFAYETLQTKIEQLLANHTRRFFVEHQARDRGKLMTHELAAERVVAKVEDFVSSTLDGSIECKRSRYE